MTLKIEHYRTAKVKNNKSIPHAGERVSITGNVDGTIFTVRYRDDSQGVLYRDDLESFAL